MSRKSRYLRIALLALCGMVSVVLIAMWARSYWKWDQFITPITPIRTIRVITYQGHIRFSAPPTQYFRDKGHIGSVWSMRQHTMGPIRGESRFTARMRSKFFVYWSPGPRGSGSELLVPFWMFVLPGVLLFVVAVTKWKLRFSLRMLLIITTLIALGLGFVFAKSC
jgi:hypothetical protein